MNNFPTVFTAQDIKDWDRHTIRTQNITSIELMERAAVAIAKWLMKQYPSNTPFYIFCGTGNNGGDGFAVARILKENEYPVYTYLLGNTAQFTGDTQYNFQLIGGDVTYLKDISILPDIPVNAVIVDAILGIGVNRPLKDQLAIVVDHLNNIQAHKVSIDIPSGWYADIHPPTYKAFKADYTLSLGVLKPSFVLPESAEYTGSIVVLDIGLSSSFKSSSHSEYFWLNKRGIQDLLQTSSSFTHKGTQGHTGLVVGSEEMMGAAILSAKAAMRSGVGKTTCILPKNQFQLLNITCPEVLLKDSKKNIPWNLFQSIGIGCGLGVNAFTQGLFEQVINTQKPVVIDADAILMAADSKHLSYSAQTIFTPHVKEAQALTGIASNSVDLLLNVRSFCVEKKVWMILKGKYSRVIGPEGKVYFNTTGNPGMATAGMGDVLTGIISALLAQGYDTGSAAMVGVYWHGLAADIAVESMGYPSLIASDVVEHLGVAYMQMISKF